MGGNQSTMEPASASVLVANQHPTGGPPTNPAPHAKIQQPHLLPQLVLAPHDQARDSTHNPVGLGANGKIRVVPQGSHKAVNRYADRHRGEQVNYFAEGRYGRTDVNQAGTIPTPVPQAKLPRGDRLVNPALPYQA